MSAEQGEPSVNDVSGPVVAGGCCGAGALDPATNGFRLSLDSSAAVPKADQNNNKTNAYLVPFQSNQIALYDSITTTWVLRTVTGAVSVTNSGVIANTSYNVYAYWDSASANVVMERVATSGATLGLKDGVQVKSTDQTRRYVGVLATNAANYFEDSAKNRLVWNRNNQVPRDINGFDLTSWSLVGNQAVWREARGSSTSRITVVSGMLNASAGAYASVQVVGMCMVSSGMSVASVANAIGIDSTFMWSSQTMKHALATTSVYAHPTASYEGYLSPGLHTISWLESGQTGTTFACIGNASVPPFGKLGMSGSIVM